MQLSGTDYRIVHYTDQSTLKLIAQSGRPGSYVTTPTQIPPGSSAREIESILEIGQGKGQNMLSGQTGLNNLYVPGIGSVTSGGAIQFQIGRPVAVGPINIGLQIGR